MNTNKYILYTCLLLTIATSGCHNFLYENKAQTILDNLNIEYANININGAKQKQIIIKEIEAAIQIAPLDVDRISALIKKMNDAHLSLSRLIGLNRTNPSQYLFSGTEFILENDNQVYLSRCRFCHENIQKLLKHKGPLKVLMVDDKKINDWIDENKSQVYASSNWGRIYKTIMKLSVNSNKDYLAESLVLKLKVDDESQVMFNLNWKQDPVRSKRCISGQEVDASTYKISIHSLWCQNNQLEDRKDIILRFKNQFKRHVRVIKSNKFKYKVVLLDLRDNGGGGDQETRYLLQNLLTEKAFLYQYQYVGQDKKIDIITPTLKSSESLSDYSLVTLINQGCMSSCEVVASVLKNSNRSKLFGWRTHGAAGDPKTWVSRDKSLKMTYPTCQVWQEDGQLYEGVGVVP
ncbi:MAG: hypothetical protein ISR65_19180 [Bacteriovoracaceae bacterium]|nr:hypothetical protein [Bacteriovoracaceae bacterium]